MFAWISRTFDSGGSIGAAWCSLMHNCPRWPIHGRYDCGICGRRYRVPWIERESIRLTGVGRRPQPKSSLLIAPAIVLFALLTPPTRAAEPTFGNESTLVAAVLQRYIAGEMIPNSWPIEMIEIEACLPKSQKTGTLRALRWTPATGEPTYKVLDIGGDRTVDRQVILRYISADQRAAEYPASSVAITAANYKIHYAGTVMLGDRISYCFRLVPRRKSEHLIKGLLWLDGETAIAIRESGVLTKSPSIFVKRINLTREIDLHDDKIALRITHVAVETRLLGKAELIIRETPFSGEPTAQIAPEAGR